jgi:uncharacterized membrane-anchored protein
VRYFVILDVWDLRSIYTNSDFVSLRVVQRRVTRIGSNRICVSPCRTTAICHVVLLPLYVIWRSQSRDNLTTNKIFKKTFKMPRWRGIVAGSKTEDRGFDSRQVLRG